MATTRTKTPRASGPQTIQEADGYLLIDIPTAARLCRISRSTIFEHVYRNRILSRKLGGRRMVEPAALRAFVKSLPTWGEDEAAA